MSNLVLNYVCDKNTTINELLLSKHYSDNNIYELIKLGNVKVNDATIKGKNFLLKINDSIKVKLNKENNELVRKESTIDIIYEDEYFLIVNKPKNLDIEPSRYNQINNLASMISYYFDKNQINSKIHLVNRLDNPTSGLVIVAKNRYIKNIFKYVKIEKYYNALLEGHLEKEGTIINKIYKDIDGLRKVSEVEGKKCITEYKIKKYIDNNTLVDIRLVTGRTHQIRVTFSSIGHPLIGDPIYNKNKSENCMFLQAYKLSFYHPITNGKIEVEI